MRCMARATSDHRCRRPISTIASRSTCSPTANSRSLAGLTGPMGMVMAASAHQPLSLQAVSIFSRSPSRIARWPGMPWTTCSLSEMQVTAGNGTLLPG